MNHAAKAIAVFYTGKLHWISFCVVKLRSVELGNGSSNHPGVFVLHSSIKTLLIILLKTEMTAVNTKLVSICHTGSVSCKCLLGSCMGNPSEFSVKAELGRL